VAPTPSAAPSEAAGGWIGGEPDWGGSGDDAAFGGDDGADELSADMAVESEASAAEPPLDDRDSTSIVEPDIPIEPDEPQGELTGGSIDDNERFDDYLAYRDRVRGLGIETRELDPTGRIIATVTGANGLPVAGTPVVVAGGGTEVTLLTTADGSVRFHPNAHDAIDGPFVVTAGDRSAEVAAGDTVVLETDLPTVTDDDVIALDILFLLDATGSMGDEIGQLKATIAEVASRIDDLPENIDVRFAMTLYRDEGDAFVTATFDFTSDIDAFASALADVVADGGGDYPEALDEALADALAEPSWRPAEEAVQLVFLVADAPPQIARAVQTPYTSSMLEAAERGIKILPVSSSGTDDQAEYVFRQLAQFTGGRYVFLTYGAGGRATGSSTDITEVDYEELSLDDLIVRSVTEELAAMTGDGTVVPTPQPTPTPEDGQGGN
jgi:Mg-chelatase subunit ChlD